MGALEVLKRKSGVIVGDDVLNVSINAPPYNMLLRLLYPDYSDYDLQK